MRRSRHRDVTDEDVKTEPFENASSLSATRIGGFVFAGCILFCILIAIIFAILAFAWSLRNEADIQSLKNRHTPKEDSTCADDNPCTADLKDKFSHKCINPKMLEPNGVECNTECFDSSLSQTCQNGECTGEGCFGECTVDANCTALNVTFTQTPDDVTCKNGVCIWEFTGISFPVSIVADNCHGTIFERACLSLRNDTVFGSCITTDTFCAENVAGEINCDMYFDCAQPQL